MARLARVVVPGYPHHPASPLFRQGYTGLRRAGITQCGNRRLPTFFCEEDYEAYLAMMAARWATWRSSFGSRSGCVAAFARSNPARLQNAEGVK